MASLRAKGGEVSNVVEEIAAEPSTLPPKLLNTLPKALATSITLQEGHGVEVQQQRVERESSKFESYYEVLELDEEYFPAFAEDLRLEVVYFFLELEELVEGVFEIYDQAKNEERTMVEATVAVKVAMDAASALTVSLQLKYPALKMAADVGFVLLNNFPGNFWRRANEAVVDFWKSFATDGTYKFVRVC
ncbi:hypothetical protein PRIC1_003592 [Phytophthora ramorum]